MGVFGAMMFGDVTKWGTRFNKKGSCKSSSDRDKSHRYFSRLVVILGFDFGVLVSCCFPIRCAVDSGFVYIS